MVRVHLGPPYFHFHNGVLAQLGERLLCTQEVRGSIPLDSTYSEEYPSLAEGIGLENRQAGHTARGFESLFLLHFYHLYYCRGVEHVRISFFE